MRKILLYCGLTLLVACQEHGGEVQDHDHKEHSLHAEAVLESSAEKGFRLSDEATRILRIETKTLQQDGAAGIPASALVYFQDEIGVYRLREGWFRLVHLDEPQELRTGDAIAVQGAAFLRVTDMSLFGDPIAGHHH